MILCVSIEALIELRHNYLSIIPSWQKLDTSNYASYAFEHSSFGIDGQSCMKFVQCVKHTIYAIAINLGYYFWAVTTYITYS